MKRKIFITSDTHFNHANIIKYCNRPFKDVKEMNEELIKRWNETVSENDIVYHLGDFGFSPKESLKEIFDRLNGYKVLIMGNHDRRGGYNYYKDLGFDEIYRKEYVLEDKYVLTHCPVDVLDGQINFFGHIHDKPIPDELNDNKHLCVCVDQWDFKPMRLLKIEPGMYVRTDEGIKKIAKYKYEPRFVNCHTVYYENESHHGLLYENDELLNATYNLIDIIEVGDYVNGDRVVAIYDKDELEEGLEKVLFTSKSSRECILEEEIETVLTKEQFDTMKLKVN